jgi:hypothetical protein
MHPIFIVIHSALSDLFQSDRHTGWFDNVSAVRQPGIHRASAVAVVKTEEAYEKRVSKAGYRIAIPFETEEIYKRKE